MASASVCAVLTVTLSARGADVASGSAPADLAQWAAPAAPAAAPYHAWTVGAAVGVVAPAQFGAPALGTGPTVGVNAGHRWRYFYLGVAYQHAFLGGGSWSAPSSEIYVVNTTWASSDYAGLDAAVLTDPEAPVGVRLRVGFGCRWVTYASNTGDGVFQTNAGTTVMSGWDASLGLGFPIRLGPLVLVPEGSFGVGLLRAAAELGAMWTFDAR
jgi:hypothetical protein